MTFYRSTEVKEAVQYLGEPIDGVTCSGVDPESGPGDYTKNHCDSSRRHLPHVHTMAMGGLTIVKHGDWIMPVSGGPFLVVDDGTFRAHFEVDGSAPKAFSTGPMPSPDGSPAMKFEGNRVEQHEER